MSSGHPIFNNVCLYRAQKDRKKKEITTLIDFSELERAMTNENSDGNNGVGCEKDILNMKDSGKKESGDFQKQ